MSMWVASLQRLQNVHLYPFGIILCYLTYTVDCKNLITVYGNCSIIFSKIWLLAQAVFEDVNLSKFAYTLFLLNTFVACKLCKFIRFNFSLLTLWQLLSTTFVVMTVHQVSLWRTVCLWFGWFIQFVARCSVVYSHIVVDFFTWHRAWFYMVFCLFPR